MNLKKIKDSMLADQYAEAKIDKRSIYDLYNKGFLKLVIPTGVSTKDFIKSVKSRIKEMWGEEDVNYAYPDVKLSTFVNGNILSVKTI